MKRSPITGKQASELESKLSNPKKFTLNWGGRLEEVVNVTEGVNQSGQKIRIEWHWRQAFVIYE